MQARDDVADPMPAADALRTLRAWAANRTDLGLLYSRADGQLLAAQRGRLQVEEHILAVRGEGSMLRAWIAGASFRHGPAPLIRRDLTLGEPVEGLHVYTEQGDWLFLFPQPSSQLMPVGLATGGA